MPLCERLHRPRPVDPGLEHRLDPGRERVRGEHPRAAARHRRLCAAPRPARSSPATARRAAADPRPRSARPGARTGQVSRASAALWVAFRSARAARFSLLMSGQRAAARALLHRPIRLEPRAMNDPSTIRRLYGRRQGHKLRAGPGRARRGDAARALGAGDRPARRARPVRRAIARSSWRSASAPASTSRRRRRRIRRPASSAASRSSTASSARSATSATAGSTTSASTWATRSTWSSACPTRA